MKARCLLFALLTACGGGEDDRRPAAPGAGGAAALGGSSSHAGSSPSHAAGEAGDGNGQAGAGGTGEGGRSEGGAAGEPEIIYEMGGVPQNMPGICNPAMELGEPEVQDVGVSGATLLSMSPDELSIVFTTESEGTLTLYVADRTSPSGAFSELAIDIPSGYAVSQGVSLSGDGLRLIVPRDDFSGFGELSRGARGNAFGGGVDEARFAKINAVEPISGQSVAWPVQSNDGKALYFVSYSARAWVKYSELGDDDTFNVGTEIDEFTLGGAEGEYKRLSGIAADQRALFFFDEASGHASALFRGRPGAPFYDPLDLGERQGVTPNADCKRIYSSTAAGIVSQPVR